MLPCTPYLVTVYSRYSLHKSLHDNLMQVSDIAVSPLTGHLWSGNWSPLVFFAFCHWSNTVPMRLYLFLYCMICLYIAWFLCQQFTIWYMEMNKTIDISIDRHILLTHVGDVIWQTRWHIFRRFMWGMWYSKLDGTYLVDSCRGCDTTN